MATLVKGIKYGTLAQYKALSSKDPDTLYFINDRGLIFRGESIVIPRKVVDATVTGQGAAQVATFTIETYTAGQTGNNLPETLTFSVRTSSAVDTVIGTINQSLNTHRIVGGSGSAQDPYVYADGKADHRDYGHVILTDTVDMAAPANNATAASGGTAVTPKGVYDAINAVLPGLAGAMQFKGTVDSAAAMPQTYNVGDVYVASADFTIGSGGRTIDLEAGDMLIANTARTEASNVTNPSHWSVVEQNLTGAVTADSNLTNDAIVLGAGLKKAKTLANGGAGNYLRVGGTGKPLWLRHAIHYATCSTAESSAAKVASTADGGALFAAGTLAPGTLVAVRFDHNVYPVKSEEDPSQETPVTLQVDGTDPHIVLHKVGSYGNYSAAPIGSGAILAIQAGDTALFIYDGNYSSDGYNGAWRLLSVDHLLKKVAFTGDYDDLSNKPNDLSEFENDIIAFGICTSNFNVNPKEVTLFGSSGFSATEGAVLVVKFNYRASINSTLCIQGDSSSQAPINDFVGYNSVSAGDTCVFIYGKASTSSDTLYWNLVGIHRPIDTTPTTGSHNLITSGGVAAAISSALSSAINKRNFYGVCNTAASTAAKQAIGVTAFELNTGAIVTVKFTNAVTASGATLALSSDNGATYTDAKYIYYDGQLLASDVIFAGDTCTFMYNGAQFDLIAFAREGLKWDSLPAIQPL